MKMLQVTIRTGKFEEELAFYKEIVGLKIVRDLREKGRRSEGKGPGHRVPCGQRGGHLH